MLKQLILFISVFWFSGIQAQTDSTEAIPIEIFIIDSYITPEVPHKLKITFSTSDSCFSKLKIKNNKSFTVSDKLNDNHKFELDLSEIRIDSSFITYSLEVTDRSGMRTESEEFTVELPKEITNTASSNAGFFQMCIGGIVFAIPSISYVRMDGKNYWSLSKEIPLISFYSEGYNYPGGYFSLEYSYIHQAEKKNFLRAGYKQIFQIEGIQYIAPGINLFGDFKGYNGMSAEISFGLFQIKNIFTFYSRYRYNFQLKKSGPDFHEFSIGLYSNFFSINF